MTQDQPTSEEPKPPETRSPSEAKVPDSKAPARPRRSQRRSTIATEAPTSQEPRSRTRRPPTARQPEVTPKPEAVPSRPNDAAPSKPDAAPSKSDNTAQSKPASPLTKGLQATAQVLTSVLSTVTKPIVNSKVYTNNKVKLETVWKRVRPLVKFGQWIWTQVLVPLWNRVVWPLWAKLLGLLRPRLPEPLKTLSDQILTAIILGPIVLLWWFISSLTSGIPTPVAQPPAPVVSAPRPAVPAAPQPQKPAMEAPEIVEEPVAEPSPPQKEVLAVQRQVAQISEQYSSALIPQVRADFEADRLVVQVSDRWYDLSSTEQDSLGLDALKRSDSLEFKSLEIRDSSGQLVARDPVVGPNIIVLQRHQF